jgi:hypothetical protein
MLGIDKEQLPEVKGRYAQEMREALYRSHKGQLNASEKKLQKYSFMILKEYESEWK